MRVLNLTAFGALTILSLLYGSIVHSQRTSVARYHHIRKPTSCGDIDRTCVYPVEYVNRHGHPNHCWNYLRTYTGSHFPNPNNESYPDRKGHQTIDLAPYATSTSVMYLASGVIILVCERKGATWVRDTTGVAVFFMLVGMSSFAFHRAPTTTTRHNDWAMISVLLTYLGMTAFELHGPVMSAVKLVAAVFQLTYENEYIALYIGAGVILAGMSVMLVRSFLTSYQHPPYIFPSSVLALVCVFTAVLCKFYGNAEPNPNLPFLAYDSYHHRAECANDQRSEQIEDISHGTWHVYGALAGLIFTLPLIGCQSFSYVEMGIVLASSVATIITTCENRGSYTGWLGLMYTSAALWMIIPVGVQLYRPSKVDYKQVDISGNY